MRFLVSFLLFLVSVSAAPFYRRIDLVSPANDSFYFPPSGYESSTVGTILKTRQIDNPFTASIIPQKIKGVYQFLVRSEDTFGNANAIVTTLFVPSNADGKKILSYQIAEDSANIDSAPSYTLRETSDSNLQADEIMMQACINQGWYVVVPDYEGPKSAFGAGIQAGRATLNSMRAVLNSGSTYGISSDAKVAYWGYSGGSIATGWASLLEPSYAPELKKNTAGYAMGGVVANIQHTAEANMGNIGAGLIITAINGLSQEYPDLLEFVDENVYADKLKAFTSPLTDDPASFLFATWAEYFKTGTSTLSNPVVTAITTANSMVSSSYIPTAPLFMYNSIIDEIIPASDATTLYTNLCKGGASISYKQDLVFGHIVESIVGSADAFVWLQARFAGTAQTGCTKQFSLSNALNLQALIGFGEIFAEPLLTLLLSGKMSSVF
ncbi:putative lipase 4 [[Candida] railenensis]|uniref:Lipase 4 n=1 Tax=[Candida] railenensis TaxID=45579 RepID=A0A9P0VZ45_9ASCO|nr:putative lipase 4 [[Candida] railenensis]